MFLKVIGLDSKKYNSEKSDHFDTRKIRGRRKKEHSKSDLTFDDQQAAFLLSGDKNQATFE